MTKTKKTAIVVLVAIMLVASILMVACDKTKTDTLANTFEYASKCTTLKVEMTKDGQLVYSYDNGKVDDKYNLGVDVSALAGDKAEKGLVIKKTDLKEGYTFNYDSATQKAELSGEFANASELLGISADKVNVSIKADLKAKSVSEYKVSYTTKDGYDIVITLY